MNLDWEKAGGLIPAIVQDSSTGQVLMLGFMNLEALETTQEIGKVTFWSRSRKCLWTKGESSGNFLQLESIQPDCDRDTLLIQARPIGPTCHRGTVTCFDADRQYRGLEFLGWLERLIQQRQQDMPENSYTTRLFREGMAKISQKLGEEAVELVVTALQDRQRTVEEAADLFYHLLVFLTAREVTLSEVMAELEGRHSPG